MNRTFVAVVLPAFIASLVEFIEALTIVLAVGTTRGWRSALVGSAAGVALLAILVAEFGRELTYAPLQSSRSYSARYWSSSGCAGCARPACAMPA